MMLSNQPPNRHRTRPNLQNTPQPAAGDARRSGTERHGCSASWAESARTEPICSVFVYGTLKRGEVRERCWPSSPVRVTASRIRAILYDLGPYPAITTGWDWVLGERWELRARDVAETLRTLDEIEGYRQDPAIDEYVRVIAECHDLDGSRHQVYTYFFADAERLQNASRIRPDAHGMCWWSATRKR